jgi:hypothetical protein
MNPVFRERFPARVSAVFDDPEAAREAAEAVADYTGDPGQVSIVAPEDAAQSSKLEPERRGIRRTLARSHLLIGVAGALAGAGIAALLVAMGPRAFGASPILSIVVLTVFGAFGGLLAGGLVSLRPDHDRVTMAVEELLRDGHHWAVVVYARSRDRRDELERLLQGRSRQVYKSV